MNTNIRTHGCQLKSAVSKLRTTGGIPFQKILPQSEIEQALAKVDYRNRYGFYPPEITLWLFLSQVLNDETLINLCRD